MPINYSKPQDIEAKRKNKHMAKRHEKFGAGADPKDARKVNKEGIRKALRIYKFILPYKWTFITGMFFLFFLT